MEIQPRQVRNFITEKGVSPFEEWHCSLKDRQTRARINVRIAKIRLGNLGDYKTVGDSILELREHYGAGYRIYCGQADKELVILLCGGDKKTQRQDIRQANEYWKDYLRREREERENSKTKETQRKNNEKKRKS